MFDYPPSGTTDVTDKFEKALRDMGIDVVRVSGPVFLTTAEPSDADKFLSTFPYGECSLLLVKEGAVKSHKSPNWTAATLSIEGWDRDYRLYLLCAYEVTAPSSYVDRWVQDDESDPPIRGQIVARYSKAKLTTADFRAEQKQWAEADHWDMTKNFGAPVPHPKTEQRMKDIGQADMYFDAVKLRERFAEHINRYADYEHMDDYPTLTGPYAEDATNVGPPNEG